MNKENKLDDREFGQLPLHRLCVVKLDDTGG